MVLAKEAGLGMTDRRLRIAEIGIRLVVGLLFAIPTAAWADSSALILSGVPGDEEHAAKFAKWTADTQKILVDNFGFSADRVLVLENKKTTKADIQGAFAKLKQQLKPLDTFFLFFIGHGSYDTDYKFNISLADFTAAEYNAMLASLNVGRIIIVNGTNSSGGSIDALAGKNRVVITATRSGQEGNDTVFYEQFLQALKDPAADEDKDTKVSVWEAFKFASAGVERFYKEDGRIATEHPSISDNGGEKIAATVKDPPVMARITSFKVDRPVASADARTQALLEEAKAIEQKIETVRINKETLAEADYEKQLETLLLQLAQKNQQIRELEKK